MRVLMSRLYSVFIRNTNHDAVQQRVYCLAVVSVKAVDPDNSGGNRQGGNKGPSAGDFAQHNRLQ